MERVPSKKEMRYDRQLRLWGDHGQQKLEEAHVCLVHATPTGTEILKSLVLPGVGRVTIVDNHVVTKEDISNNFFLTPDSDGKSRGQIACELLKELNDEVKVSHVEKSSEELIESNPAFFDHFTVVVACGLIDKHALALSVHCWNANIPLLLCRCVGLVGYARICVREHCVIETHPENPFHDLRLDCPFPALREHVDSIDLDSMSHVDHSHTPYLVLMMKALQTWQATQDDPTTAFPTKYAEKKQIQTILKDMRKPDEKGNLHEDNFEEAINNANRTFRKTEIPSAVKQLLDEAAAMDFAGCSESTAVPFWFVAAAMHKFVHSHNGGLLPLSGGLPDMTADSSKYIQLQHVYQNAALRDAKSVHSEVQTLVAQASLPFDLIPFEFTVLCCKHAYELHCLKGRSLAAEYKEPDTSCMKQQCSEDAFCWYAALRARERFLEEKNRFPGTNGIPCALDTADVQQRIRALAGEWQMDDDDTDTFLTKTNDFAAEICRYGSSEVHAVASVLGGICAHECIKLITHQYLPFNNTYIYDANTHNSQVYTL